MLYNVLKTLIEQGASRKEMLPKLDVFMAAGRITIEQYEELSKMLKDRPEQDEVTV